MNQAYQQLYDRLFHNPALRKSLRGAHIPITEDQYMMRVLFATCAALILFLGLGVVCSVLEIAIPVLSEILPLWIITLICCIVFPTIVFVMLYFYPAMAATGRKNKINTDLPYVITYMQAVSSTLTSYGVIKAVADAKDLCREISVEFSLIVRDVEVFGLDLMTAMENAREITPSESLAALLNDMSLVFRSGGSMPDFFSAKSETYREIARQQLDSNLQFLEMMAEIYVTAFVAGPIALIIMIVAQSLTGQGGNISWILPLVYVFLPVGALIIMCILYVILPPDNLEIKHQDLKEVEFCPDIVDESRRGVDKKFVKKIESTKMTLRIREILAHPLKFYISNYYVGIAIGMVLALVVFYLYINGTFVHIFPEYTFQVLVCTEVVMFSLPVIFSFEIRKKYITKIEREMPDFMREISDMKEIGMTLQSSINMIAENKTGALSTEIKTVSSEVSYGTPVSHALRRMEERIGLVSVKRALSLLIYASEITDDIRDIIAIAVTDLDHYLRMKFKRGSVSVIYVAVIYLSFGIYLFASYAILVSFLAGFESFDLNFNIEGTLVDMFNIGIILGFFSGLMAGQMASNSLLSGLKHSAIMLILTVVVFIYVI